MTKQIQKKWVVKFQNGGRLKLFSPMSYLALTWTINKG